MQEYDMVLCLVFAILGSFLLAVFVSWVIKKYAFSLGMVDVPNERSLHVIETPRGGGLGIIAPMVIALIIMMLGRFYDNRSLAALMCSTLILALTGWFDDRFGLHVLSRIVIQVFAGIIVLSMLGAYEQLELAGKIIFLGSLAPLVTLFWFLWMTNLYNFMDGIDGVAASQAAIAGFFLGLWFAIHNDYVMALFSYVIMSASLGFLVWNWAPARLFMGDVGSLALGGVFSVIALIAYKKHGIPFGAIVLLFGVFIADTTFTLIKRVLQRKAFWRAHREHVYQKAVAAGWSHLRVTTSVIVISVIMATLGTFEMLRVYPQQLWQPLGILLLATIAVVMVRRTVSIID